MSEPNETTEEERLLRIRSLIADKEFCIALCNGEVAWDGEWRTDYHQWYADIERELLQLLPRPQPIEGESEHE